MVDHFMNKVIKKKNIPLLFLIGATFFWSYYYTTENWFNDYGKNKSEVWLLIDTFFTLPLLCFYCFWDDKKTAALKTLVYVSLLVLLGSYIIPQLQKNLWFYLENMRYVVIAGFLIMEIMAVFTVIFAIKAAFKKNTDPDEAIAKPLVKYVGDSMISTIMQVEARVWTFLLFAKKVKTSNFKGDQHFYSHLKDGVQSTLLGFIIITCIEMPIVHTLLYFMWSPYAANVVSLLTFISLIYFIAQYRAIAMRPVSMTKDKLIIRYSLSNPLQIDYSQVESITLNTLSVSRNKNIKRYNLFGVPNVKITLKSCKKRPFNEIYLGLNNPSQFLKSYSKLN